MPRVDALAGLSVSGDTIVVGAYGEDSNQTTTAALCTAAGGIMMMPV